MLASVALGAIRPTVPRLPRGVVRGNPIWGPYGAWGATCPLVQVRYALRCGSALTFGKQEQFSSCQTLVV